MSDNVAPPINNLPVEILLKMFAIRRTDSVEDATDRGTSWLRQIMHVCKFWRSIARNDPTLWCVITSRVPREWQFLHLEHSLTLPLRLHWNYNSPQQGSGLSPSIFQHLRRVRELHIQFSEAPSLHVLMTRPAPQLETLEINYDGLWRINAAQFAPQPRIRIPDNLFFSQSPRLRILRVGKRVRVELSSTLLSTHLEELHDTSDGKSITSSLRELQMVPNLLVLEWSLSKRAIPLGERLAHLQTVTLSRLRMLRVLLRDRESLSAALHFFKYVKAPSLEHIQIILYAVPSPTTDVDLFIEFPPLLKAFICQLEAQGPLRSATVCLSQASELNIRCWHEDILENCDGSNPLPACLSWHSWVYYNPDSTNNSLQIQDIQSSFTLSIPCIPLGNVTTLTLGIRTNCIPPSEWEATLSSMHAVETFRLLPKMDSLHILSQTIPSVPPSEGTYLFPSLKKLIIPADEVEDCDEELDGWSEPQALLAAVVKARHVAGRPLLVIIDQCLK
ncbi:hypothetical protein OF83DRAFT_1175374, partial [Amylostereum chailletii]